MFNYVAAATPILHSVNIIDLLLNDVRTAMRSLAKHRCGSALAVVSVALGIGLTTALFAVADALLFRPTLFPQPEEIHTVYSRGDDQRIIGFGWRDCENMARVAGGDAEIAACQRVGSVLATDADTEVVLTYIATPNFFPLLGVRGFLLTAAGLFGLVQYSVNRRTREIGVRVALGAGPGIILRSVLADSLRIVAPGIAAGLVLLAGGAWCVRSALLDVAPLDPLAYTGCATAAIGVALLATWLPASRATRVDPLVALRAV
jgi:hypothetical protein